MKNNNLGLDKRAGEQGNIVISTSFSDLNSLQGRQKVKNIGGANEFYGEAPLFDAKILVVLNANILPISRNIGGAIAPPATPVPSPLLGHSPL